MGGIKLRGHHASLLLNLPVCHQIAEIGKSRSIAEIARRAGDVERVRLDAVRPGFVDADLGGASGSRKDVGYRLSLLAEGNRAPRADVV